MDPKQLAEELFPHIRALLIEAMKEVCVHQYVMSAYPRRRYTRHEAWITYEFFCEHCLDVKHRTFRYNRRGEVSVLLY
jgi:hypothetical protein